MTAGIATYALKFEVEFLLKGEIGVRKATYVSFRKPLIWRW